jgi:hypothetical protein
MSDLGFLLRDLTAVKYVEQLHIYLASIMTQPLHMELDASAGMEFVQHSFIHSFVSLSYDRFTTSPKTPPSQSLVLPLF